MIDGDGVEVTLDEDGAVVAPHRVFAAMNVVEQPRFVEELRLGGVEVFRLAAVE
jgi:hypothetical protein